MEAAMATLQQQLAQMATDMQQLAAQRTADQARLMQQEADLQAMQAQSAKGAGKQAEPHFDVRALKGLDAFDGNQKSWRDWSIVTKSYAGVMNPALIEIIRTAEDQL